MKNSNQHHAFPSQLAILGGIQKVESKERPMLTSIYQGCLFALAKIYPFYNSSLLP